MTVLTLMVGEHTINDPEDEGSLDPRTLTVPALFIHGIDEPIMVGDPTMYVDCSNDDGDVLEWVAEMLRKRLRGNSNA